MSVAKVVVPTLIDEPGCTVQRVPRDSPFWGRRARPYSPCRRDIVTFVNFLAPVVASIVVGGVQITLYLLGRRSTRERLKSDLELVALLPENSPAREALLKRAEGEISQIVKEEVELTRDPAGATLAVLFLGGALVLAFTAARANPFWWILVAVLAVFGAVGFSLDGVKRRRDEKGNAIRSAR